MNDVAKSNGAKDAADAGKIATYDARELVKTVSNPASFWTKTHITCASHGRAN